MIIINLAYFLSCDLNIILYSSWVANYAMYKTFSFFLTRFLSSYEERLCDYTYLSKI